MCQNCVNGVDLSELMYNFFFDELLSTFSLDLRGKLVNVPDTDENRRTEVCLVFVALLCFAFLIDINRTSEYTRVCVPVFVC